MPTQQPEDPLWEAVQRQRAADRAKETYLARPDDAARKAELEGVDETFQTYRESDFGRKLYLVQNCLHGTDIQPVAGLIAKLRFFISLAIEQETSRDPALNYGVRPLPNLETRIIAADTLIGFPGQAPISTSVQKRMEADLRANRERHFHATTYAGKQACRERDEELRQALSSELRGAGLSRTAAARVAEWDPYDQNASATWFDTEYMFGERGFDIVIGNPPYRQLQKDGGRLGNKYKDAGFRSFVRTGDLYQLFIEKGMDLLRGEDSVLAYVTSNSWQKAKYGSKTRKLLDGHSPVRFINLGPGVFENAVVDTCVLVVRRASHGEPCRTAELSKGDDFPPREADWASLRQIANGPWCVLSRAEWSLMEKIEAAGKPLGEWPGISIYRGLVTGLNKAFIVGNETKEALIREDPRSAELLKPIVRGRDIRPYRVDWAELWLIDAHNGYGDTARVDVDRFPAIKRHLDGFMPDLERRQDQGDTPYNLRSCAYYGDFEKPKIFWPEISDEAEFALCRELMFCNNKAYFLTAPSLDELLYLFAVLGSDVIRWYGRQITVTTGAGAHSWFKYSVEALPIPPRGVAEDSWPASALAAREEADRQTASPAAITEQDAALAERYGLSDHDKTLLDSLEPRE